MAVAVTPGWHTPTAGALGVHPVEGASTPIKNLPPACNACGATDRPVQWRGMCSRCYQQALRGYRPRVDFACADCGARVRRYTDTNRCVRCAWLKPPRELTCPECGTTFTTTHNLQVTCSEGCSVKRRHRYNATRPRDRKRRFPPIHGRRRHELFERDGWTCGICHALIDQGLRFPHPGSPSIDHVDPAGPHEPGNWQAAHFACNTAKGAKAA